MFWVILILRKENSVFLDPRIIAKRNGRLPAPALLP